VTGKLPSVMRNDTPQAHDEILEERRTSAGLLLALVGQEAMRRLRAAHAAVELSPRSFQVLALLHDRGDMSQADLHAAMDLDPSALVQLLNPLEERGLIERRRDVRDRRRHMVSLTGFGERELDRAASAQREAEDELFAALDAEQRRLLAELLLAVRESSAGERPCQPDGPGGAGGEAADSR
jgi:DNA-binding MarR family transcriptional regulator